MAGCRSRSSWWLPRRERVIVLAGVSMVEACGGGIEARQNKRLLWIGLIGRK